MWQYQRSGMTREKDKREKRKIKQTWSIKCMIIPVIIRATGIVAKGMKKNEKATTIKYLIYLVKRQLYSENRT
jgi:HJR/Mrr/RecB family endonuclease